MSCQLFIASLNLLTKIQQEMLKTPDVWVSILQTCVLAATRQNALLFLVLDMSPIVRTALVAPTVVWKLSSWISKFCTGEEENGNFHLQI